MTSAATAIAFAIAAILYNIGFKPHRMNRMNESKQILLQNILLARSVCKRDMISTMHAKEVKAHTHTESTSNQEVATKFDRSRFQHKIDQHHRHRGHNVNVINNIHS